MPDFNVRADSVKVEPIMERIRARIREKRGVDYTEQQIRELAAVKLEKLLDPKGVRSDLLEQFRLAQSVYALPGPSNYAFEEQTLYESHRAPVRWIRRLLRPLLKLFFNPNPLIQALHIQSQLNTMIGRREVARDQFDQLHYEVMHNLVIETTRMGIEIKNLKMRVESLTSRLEFNERRARALENVVVYKPSSEDRADEPVQQIPAASEPGSAVHEPAAVGPEGPGQRSRRRRRRRGRRGTGSAATIMGAAPGSSAASSVEQNASTPSADTRPRVEIAEATAQPLAGESRAMEPIEQSGPSTNAGPEGTRRGDGEPDGEQ